MIYKYKYDFKNCPICNYEIKETEEKEIKCENGCITIERDFEEEDYTIKMFTGVIYYIPVEKNKNIYYEIQISHFEKEINFWKNKFKKENPKKIIDRINRVHERAFFMTSKNINVKLRYLSAKEKVLYFCLILINEKIGYMHTKEYIDFLETICNTIKNHDYGKEMKKIFFELELLIKNIKDSKILSIELNKWNQELKEELLLYESMKILKK